MTKKGGRRRGSKKMGLVYSSALILLLIITVVTIRMSLLNSIHEDFKKDKKMVLDEMSHRIFDHFNRIEVDLQYLAFGGYTHKFLELQSQASGIQLSSLMEEMIRLNESYIQVTLLDEMGKEIIRLERTEEGMITSCENKHLKYRGDTACYIKSLDAPYDCIFMTSFHLKEENEEIFIPYIPIVHFTHKIFGKDNDLTGTAIITFNGMLLFKELTAVSESEAVLVYLVSEDGYYIFNPDSSKSFGSILDERSRFRFQADFPEVWSSVSNSEFSEVDNKQGIFLSHKIHPVNNSGHRILLSEEDLFLILRSTPGMISSAERRLNLGLTIGSIILTPFLIFLGITLGITRDKNRWYMEELKRMAQRDPMTGLYNRNFLKDRLDYCMKTAERRNESLTLAFLDVNDLKKVNDILGHEEGDRLITSAASTIVDCVRDTDTVIRMGGDEFVVILPNCSREMADQIMTRISSNLGEKGNYDDGKAWTISWGCSGYRHEKDNQHNLISRADRRMYEKKKSMKKEDDST